MYYSTLDNLLVSKCINVSTQYTPTNTTTLNVVITSFDVRDRIFYCVTNLDISNNIITTLTTTTFCFEDIDFRATYVSHTTSDLRHLVIQYL